MVNFFECVCGSERACSWFIVKLKTIKNRHNSLLCVTVCLCALCVCVCLCCCVSVRVCVCL